MGSHVRPLSRLMAVELTDTEIDQVGGGFFEADSIAQTDVYTRTSNPDVWKYDGSHGGD